MTRHLIATFFVLSLCGAGSTVDAAIIDLLRYNLGEPGTFVGQAPQDSIGSRHFTNAIGTITPGGILDTAAPNSTQATRYSPSNTVTGAYGASSLGLPTDNFAVELWVRSADVNQPFNTLLALNGGTLSSLSFHAGNGVWSASLFGMGWIGANAGVGQTATDNEWTNLAVIRSNNVSTFYINAVPQAGSTAAAPSMGTDPFGIHLAISPGGASWFRGDIDSVRIFSFDPNVDNPVAALSSVPEPSSLALMGCSAVALGWFVRRRKKSAAPDHNATA